MEDPKRSIITISVCVAGITIALVAGYVLGLERGRSSIAVEKDKDIVDLETRLADAEDRLKEIYGAPEDVRTFVGIVKEMTTQGFVMETDVLPDIPPSSDSPRGKELRTVFVTSETEVFKIVYPSEIPTTSYAVPEEIASTFSAIHIGDEVHVTAGENVKERTEFPATIVRFTAAE